MDALGKFISGWRFVVRGPLGPGVTAVTAASSLGFGIATVLQAPSWGLPPAMWATILMALTIVFGTAIIWDRQQRLDRRSERIKILRNSLRAAKEEAAQVPALKARAEEAEQAIATFWDPTKTLRHFVELHDQADEVSDLFNLGLPQKEGALEEAVTSYKRWINLCTSLVGTLRVKYALRLREAQVLNPREFRHGMERLAGVNDGRYFDTELPREYQARIANVKALLREIVDRG